MWLVNILLHSAFVFSDPKPRTIDILYRWWEICGQFRLCSYMSFLLYNQIYIIYNQIYIIFVIWSFYMYIYIYYILLWSFELIAILLISSIKTMCFSLLYLCCAFEITLLFFMNSLSCFWRLYISISVRNGIFYFKLSCF